MKQILYFLTLFLLFLPCVVYARSPYTSYQIRFISYKLGEKTAFSPASNSIIVSEGSIIAYGTNKGRKNWDVQYKGRCTLKNWGNFVFHKFYLTNHNVYFYVSDEKIFSGDGTLYYVINFDGQIQLAL